MISPPPASFTTEVADPEDCKTFLPSPPAIDFLKSSSACLDPDCFISLENKSYQALLYRRFSLSSEQFQLSLCWQDAILKINKARFQGLSSRSYFTGFFWGGGGVSHGHSSARFCDSISFLVSLVLALFCQLAEFLLFARFLGWGLYFSLTQG